MVEQGKPRLAEGEWVVIFPEGTRMPPGETRKYGVSGALLARETGRLIVPVAHDAGYYWPRRGLFKRPGTVRVVIGPPVSAQGRNLREVERRSRPGSSARCASSRRPMPESRRRADQQTTLSLRSLESRSAAAHHSS